MFFYFFKSLEHSTNNHNESDAYDKIFLLIFTDFSHMEVQANLMSTSVPTAPREIFNPTFRSASPTRSKFSSPSMFSMQSMQNSLFNCERSSNIYGNRIPQGKLPFKPLVFEVNCLFFVMFLLSIYWFIKYAFFGWFIFQYSRFQNSSE